MAADQIQRREIDGYSIRHDAAVERMAREGGWWLDTTIADAAARLASAEPDRVLVVDGELRLTALRLHDDAARLADALRARGIGRGDVVSFMLPNWHEACVIYLATAMLGAVSHPLVTNFRQSELEFMLADCRSKAIFIPSDFRQCDYRELLAGVCRALKEPPLVSVVRGEAGDFPSYDEFVAGGQADARFEPVDPGAVRMILYTSGTTGKPKGVLHTHNSINADIVQLHRYWNRGEFAKYLVASPISHIGGSLYTFEMPLLFGTCAVLMERWDGGEGVRLIEAEQCTHMAGATPFLEHLLAAAKAAGTRLPSLRIFICGGASVPPSLIREANAHFENAVATRVYGSTEVPTITVGSVEVGDLEHAAETDGRIGAGEMRVSPFGGGADGELLARGPQMLVGYLDRRDEEGAFDEDGFFRMGDLGQIVDDGYVVVTGRLKDIIIRNGENISPKEVEDILIAHPSVAEIAIVGLPHERTGEIACAFVVPVPGERLALPDLIELLAERGTARFKYPERLELCEELPRNAAGKVLKHRLRDALVARQETP